MIRVSRLADYGTVVMVFLAKHNDKLHNARDIAQNTKVSLATVSKLLKLLLKSGLLQSKQGSKGGYSLAREPKDIAIVEILQALDGHFGMTDCSHAKGRCHLEPFCSISSNWQIISHAIYHALTCISLEDMTKPIARKMVAQNFALLKEVDDESRI